MRPTASPRLGLRTLAAKLLACAIRRRIPVRIDHRSTGLKPACPSLQVVTVQCVTDQDRPVLFGATGMRGVRIAPNLGGPRRFCRRSQVAGR
jgi:hypothetical protein